ncbi:acyltransferase family protein [Flammeovirga yaeyamensis]|uniref:Acyltransferase family protein n=1 Tax=Flammeovirga yaeyamensis TaxID=367791 RepID=A0AAX1N5R1_9BACT|nr:acyltransferase [Flammeovirga yaeyamensis]MBB3701312.1 peptidoglycan/LPS O-acetylase OafA/YrhL [Flammeovirga yaeyamensis]NMF38219.1 acyltransferase [Flammeovirga yaeyamensis]QWG02631.1 acyltransferase family protein [Flammeovirga yaeyamensis]
MSQSTNKHFEILDGMRGVAAIIVVAFHILEAFALGDRKSQIINHGYLAVDFFFVLSGFVIGYAYDNRWDKMTLGGFFKRRIIRLQPMVIMGSIIGAATFYLQASPELYANLASTEVKDVIIVMLIGFTMIPVGRSFDVRGWGEMYPLNGPGWTLFFEYIAYTLYALILRRLPNIILMILAGIAAGFLIHLSVTADTGTVAGGWSLDPEQLKVGMIRLSYPFLSGLLLSRFMKRTHIKHSFLISSILMALVLSLPRLGGDTNWINGLYEALVIIFIFPLIVYLGANGEIKNEKARKFAKFLGDISYPIYITHYAFIYMYTAFVFNEVLPEKQNYGLAAVYGVLTFVVSILVAYLSVKFYDEPLRKWWSKKWLKS